MTCTDLCTDLLPPQAPLQIETMAMTERGMTLDVAVTTSQALCPTCTQPSTHIHSDYRRTLADLPWATTPVQLHLRVRRFWCETPHCARRTFTERVPQVAPCSARTTARLHARQTVTGLALGGRRGRGTWLARESPAAGIRSCDACAVSPRQRPHGRVLSASTTGRNARAIPMARSWWIWIDTAPSICSKTVPLRPWRPGSRPIPR